MLPKRHVELSFIYAWKQTVATPRKNVACVNITEICIANGMSSVQNVVKNSKWKRLRCFAFSLKMQAENERDNLKTRNNYSLHMQEVVLCKKINQR
jgi:hypothetical protein